MTKRIMDLNGVGIMVRKPKLGKRVVRFVKVEGRVVPEQDNSVEVVLENRSPLEQILDAPDDDNEPGGHGPGWIKTLSEAQAELESCLS